MTAGRAPGDIATDLAEVSRFGGEGTGLTRLAWTHELRAAYDWLGERLEALGLRVEVDAAGNLLGKWEAGSGRAVVVGSHLDSVRGAAASTGRSASSRASTRSAACAARGLEPRRPLWVVGVDGRGGLPLRRRAHGEPGLRGRGRHAAWPSGVTPRARRSATPWPPGTATPTARARRAGSTGWARTWSCTSSRARSSRGRARTSAW